MAEDATSGRPGGRIDVHGFGTCCTELKEAMSGDEFEPLISVGPNGVLYLAVGIVDLEDDQDAGMVDHPLFFCPFCGRKLQTPEAVAAKGDVDDDEDDDDAGGDTKEPQRQ